MNPDEVTRSILPHTTNVARCTIPFFGDFPDKKDTFGSGVLLKIAGSHFIITAAHVADFLSNKDVGVYLPGPSETSTMKAILCEAGKIVKSKRPNGNRFDDVFDVGIIELHNDVAVKLSSFMTFLSLDDFELNPETLKRGTFAFVGYPEMRNERDDAFRVIIATVLPYITDFLHSSHREYNPNIHVSLRINDRKESDHSFGLNIDGLGNISGCGMWRFGDENVPVSSLDWSNFKLVALLHSQFDKPDVVVGTKLKIVIRMLFQEFKATRAEIMQKIPEYYLY